MSKTLVYALALLCLSAFTASPSVAQLENNPFITIDWKPIVLTSPDAVLFVAAPSSKNRSAEIQSAQKNLDNLSLQQKSQVEHWQQNHLIRWNELTRELIAAHNAPPICLPDSSGYPTPNRARPNDTPRYPFATPPYASRVFAYVSVAQHDALLVARFHQKATPSVYLSDAAVISGATVAVLAHLFPAEMEYLKQKEEIAYWSILKQSRFTPNELDASLKLGKDIGEKVIIFAQNDGYDNTPFNPNQWQQNLNRRKNENQMVWQSNQKPIRAPIEPFFGNVKAWFITDKATIRPTPPPSTESEELKKEVAFVQLHSRVSTKEKMQIVTRWSDAEFTHTPIGHWNLIACDLFQKNKTDDEQKVRILATLNRALMDAAIACWEAKTYYCYPRPTQVDKDVHRHLPLPNFPSYPSGHSSFSGAAATVLSHFFQNESQKLFEMAEEASISRVYAALHFRMDCDAGMVLGKKVGELALKNQ
ncbi:MAG: vanadium-dependent haloperoxidase [Saprospiraceae bacterium]|nr:vanadium-dependent haloperoxidase [Saprospiraceae bacterium]